jgi:hypothetical protein
MDCSMSSWMPWKSCRKSIFYAEGKQPRTLQATSQQVGEDSLVDQL